MQSYSINLDYVDSICNKCIKSLSDDDDDDDDDQKDFDEYYEQQKEHDSEHKHSVPMDASAYTVHSDSTQESEEENEAELHSTHISPQQQQQQEHLLDKDIKIISMLTRKGYQRLHKLCFTDQGSVWRAIAPKGLGSKSVVIKIASKIHYNTPSQHEDIIKEIELLSHLNTALNDEHCTSPHLKDSIIEVIDSMETEDNYMVVLEDGGIDLFQFISTVHQEIKNKKITIKEWQKTVKLIAEKVLELMHWLHSQMFVCHGDISLENILINNIEWITYPDQEKNYKKKLSPTFKLKLIDFGAAKCFKQCAFDGKVSFESCCIVGKPTYCCPDIYKLQNKLLTTPFDARKSDIWSFGVAFFIMAIGCPPWQQPDDNNELFHTIVLEKNLHFVLNAWGRANYIEDSMKDLLQNIFVMDEKNRISTADMIKHYF